MNCHKLSQIVPLHCIVHVGRTIFLKMSTQCLVFESMLKDQKYIIWTFLAMNLKSEKIYFSKQNKIKRVDHKFKSFAKEQQELEICLILAGFIDQQLEKKMSFSKLH